MTRILRAGAVLLALSGSSALAVDVTLVQEGSGRWRASKLAGVPIYGPDDKRIGKIDDALIGKDGKVQFLVVGIPFRKLTRGAARSWVLQACAWVAAGRRNGSD